MSNPQQQQQPSINQGPQPFVNKNKQKRQAQKQKRNQAQYGTAQKYSQQARVLEDQYQVYHETPQVIYKKYQQEPLFKQSVDQYAQGSNIRSAELAVGRKFASDASRDLMGKGFNELTPGEKKLVLAILELDDWTTVASYAMPLVEKYGPKIWNSLKDWWNSGTTERKSLDDKYQTQIVQKHPLYQPIKSQSDLVCTEYIACLICPEYFKDSRPGTYATKVSVFSASVNYPVISNISGNVGLAINMLGFAGSATGQRNFITIMNTSTFNIQTGQDNLAPIGNYLQGPGYSSPANIMTARANAMAVQFIPTQSQNNNQGVCQAILVQEQITPPFVASNGYQPSIGTSTMSMYPFYQEKNMGNVVRSIYVPCAADESGAMNLQNNVNWYSDVIPFNTYNQYMYFLVTGAAASQQVGTLQVSVVADYTPSPSISSFTDQKYPCVAPGTNNFIGALFREYPHIQSLSYDQAFKLAGQIHNCGGNTVDYDKLMKLISEFMNGIPMPKKVYSLTPYGNQNNNLVGSMDVISFSE